MCLLGTSQLQGAAAWATHQLHVALLPAPAMCHPPMRGLSPDRLSSPIRTPYCTPKSPLPPHPHSCWRSEGVQLCWHARPAGTGPPSCRSCPGPRCFKSCLHSQPREQTEAKFSLLQIVSWTGRRPPLSLSHIDTGEAGSLCSGQEDLLV